jgi:hypothetical protein
MAMARNDPANLLGSEGLEKLFLIPSALMSRSTLQGIFTRRTSALVISQHPVKHRHLGLYKVLRNDCDLTAHCTIPPTRHS